MVSDGLRIHQITDRQHFLQQIRRSCKRDQGCPLRLQIWHFWAGLPVEPTPHWTERLGTLRLAGASVPSRIGHLNWLWCKFLRYMFLSGERLFRFQAARTAAHNSRAVAAFPVRGLRLNCCFLIFSANSMP